MASRAYVAHDRAISAARMYIQMAVVGFLLASILYAGVMTTVLIPLCCRSDPRATGCRWKAPAERESREPTSSALFAREVLRFAESEELPQHSAQFKTPGRSG